MSANVKSVKGEPKEWSGCITKELLKLKNGQVDEKGVFSQNMRNIFEMVKKSMADRGESLTLDDKAICELYRDVSTKSDLALADIVASRFFQSLVGEKKSKDHAFLVKDLVPNSFQYMETADLGLEGAASLAEEKEIVEWYASVMGNILTDDSILRFKTTLGQIPSEVKKELMPERGRIGKELFRLNEIGEFTPRDCGCLIALLQGEKTEEKISEFVAKMFHEYQEHIDLAGAYSDLWKTSIVTGLNVMKSKLK